MKELHRALVPRFHDALVCSHRRDQTGDEVDLLSLAMPLMETYPPFPSR